MSKARISANALSAALQASTHIFSIYEFAAIRQGRLKQRLLGTLHASTPAKLAVIG